MIYEQYTIGGELMHSAKGTEWAHAKYIDKVKTKNGKWRYIYENTLNYKKNKAKREEYNNKVNNTRREIFSNRQKSQHAADMSYVNGLAASHERILAGASRSNATIASNEKDKKQKEYQNKEKAGKDTKLSEIVKDHVKNEAEQSRLSEYQSKENAEAYAHEQKAKAYDKADEEWRNKRKEADEEFKKLEAKKSLEESLEEDYRKKRDNSLQGMAVNAYEETKYNIRDLIDELQRLLNKMR